MSPKARRPGGSGPKKRKGAGSSRPAAKGRRGNGRAESGEGASGRGSGRVRGRGAEFASREPRPPRRTPQPELPRDVWRSNYGGTAIGVVSARGRFLTAVPLFERGAQLTLEKSSRVKDGDIVFISTSNKGKGHRVIRNLGSQEVAANVLEALLLDKGLPRRTAKSVQTEAEGVAQHSAEFPRRDIRSKTTFTIDPKTARDFDDAISAEQGAEGTIRISVHIADVAAYVRPGGAIDRDAQWRGTSVYVPGTVEPMLPRVLSEGACSLAPNVDRNAVTVEFDVASSGEVSRCRVDRTEIHSDVRLTYDEVDEIFSGAVEALEPWAGPLELAREAARRLLDRRRNQTSALELDSGEPAFEFDENGHVVGIKIERQTESHRLIEQLMVAANSEVAKVLRERESPALYRVHGMPTPEAVRKLSEQLAELEIPMPAIPDEFTETEAAEIVSEISKRVDAHVRRVGHGRTGLSYLVLRSLQQARYQPKPLGHAGLGLVDYCHFTSPIRRYPDLVAHRAILALVGAGEDPPPTGEELLDLGIRCSATEREAIHIERLADRITRAFMLRSMLYEHGWDQTFQGEISGVIAAGVFVRFGGENLDDDAFEGFVPVRTLGDEWWEVNELQTMLVASRSGGKLKIGDPLKVGVQSVDPQRGKVTLFKSR